MPPKVLDGSEMASKAAVRTTGCTAVAVNRALVALFLAAVGIGIGVGVGIGLGTSRAPAVTYEWRGRFSVEALNTILRVEGPAFTNTSAVNYTLATNEVDLYRVVYESSIPERGGVRTLASGLVAVPVGAGAPGRPALPLLSYQHGTVLSKTEVPSFVEATAVPGTAASAVSNETRLVIAQFAGQGYAVFAADYFGLGLSTEADGFVVLGSHKQACFDMYKAALVVLAAEHVPVQQSEGLFITGWSQGGIVTMAFLEHLESKAVTVRGAGTAAAPCDAFALFNGYLNFPRKIDAEWITALFILTGFSFENYYGLPGLARSLFVPKFYDTARRIYAKEATEGPWPENLSELIRREYFDTQFFAASTYGRLMLQEHAYRWVVKSPVQMHYGGQDEIVSAGLATLPAEFQRAMGAGNDKVVAVPAGDKENHRSTFGIAVQKWKMWFDEIVKNTTAPV